MLNVLIEEEIVSGITSINSESMKKRENQEKGCKS